MFSASSFRKVVRGYDCLISRRFFQSVHQQVYAVKVDQADKYPFIFHFFQALSAHGE
jgi:hypothetical protein